MVAIEIVVRGNKYKLSPITEDYLISSPSREPTSADEGLGSADDDSKPEHFNHPPAFEPRYATALRKLRRTSRELFPQNLPSFEATHQGMLGDCPFVSTVGAMVYRNPAAVKAMVTQNDNGTFTVTLGGGRIIKINSLTDADIALWSSAGTNGLWFTVLEKAYRRILLTSDPKMHQKVLDIYDKFSSSKTIEILDGHQTRKVEIRNIRMSSAQLDGLRKELVAALREHLLVKARTPAGTKIRGITPDHEYAILGYYRDTDLVRVWNPHGNNFTPKGPDGLQNGYTTRTGEFDIPFKDLLQIFSDLTFETHIAVRN